MVPVIRNVEGMNFADIEKAINLLGEKVMSCHAFKVTCLSELFCLCVISGNFTCSLVGP